MKCKIRTVVNETKEVPYYKTKYKNVVITKIDKDCYSITHWQTGIAISQYPYIKKKEAIEDLPRVIEKMRNTNINIKKFCKERNLKQINF